MSSDKRLLAAVAISFLILIVYPVYLRWITPKTVSGPAGMETAAVATDLKWGAAAPQSVPQETFGLTETLGAAPPRQENFYEFSNARFDAQFSDRGAVITKLKVKRWDRDGNGDAILINQGGQESKALLVTLPNQGVDFTNEIFSLEALNERTGEVRFSAQIPGRWRLVKHFQFDIERPVVRLAVTAENLSGLPQTAALQVTSDLSVDTENAYDRHAAQSFSATREKLIGANLDKIAKSPLVSEGEILWHALTRKHFSLIVRPDEPAALSKSWAVQRGPDKNASVMRNELRFAPAQVSPSQVLTREFLVYTGPQYYTDLKSFDHGFERILSHGFFGTFKLWLLISLQWSYKTIGNYGWAIILVTCVIKLLFTPFTHMSFESMRKMQALQPKMKALQEQYKKDQAKLSQETMALYKRHKVNPMGGCLPMLLQIPVFIAFYQVLVQTVELKGAPFVFWIRDLSEPDRLTTLPFSLPFLGNGVNVLPILMLLSMVWQQRLTPQAGPPEQQKMMMLMPIMFGFIFYNLPSGLVLYWLVNNVLSIFHQLFVKGKALPHHEE